MVHVTAIRRRRPGDSVVDIVLDSGEVCVSTIAGSPSIGSRQAALGGPGLDALRRAAAADAAERRALGLIARRPRSEAELRTRMAGWGVDEVTAAGVLERLADLGQVDDRRLAAAVTESRLEQGYGRLGTAHDLARLAVDEPAAAAALGTLPDAAVLSGGAAGANVVATIRSINCTQSFCPLAAQA